MDIDGAALGHDLGRTEAIPVHTELCRSQLGAFKSAVHRSDEITVACTQEAALFEEVANQERGENSQLTFVNIRENAGWCSTKKAAHPKIAALLAEAALPTTPVHTTTLKSDGVCLIYGSGQTALEAAVKLSKRLHVTLLLTDAEGIVPPSTANFAIAKGRVRSVTGRLGAYNIEVDGYAPALPSSRAKLAFDLSKNGAKSRADLIVDLSGKTALFPPGARRDGYLRASPTDPAAIAETLFNASDLVGEFEKPLYIDFNAGICAHTRSGKPGCHKCLDVCPTGAIAPAGDHVVIDATICAGCGTCAAVCPTGAASYNYPVRIDLIARLNILISTYLKAGGSRPIILAYDETHGRPLIDALAHERDGLPSNVLPFALHSISSLGHDAIAATLTMGADHILLLGSPSHRDEHPAIASELALLDAILEGLGYTPNGAALIVTSDPDELDSHLKTLSRRNVITPTAFASISTKRDLARTVMGKLHTAAPKPQDWIALPKQSPYGRIAIKTDGCTLCLACVGACPANALADNPERPELSFTEAACVQCGICVATCPEQVITLEPGYNFTTAALSPVVMKAEEPFHCISCAKPFGTKSTINRVIEKLQGRHAMFKNPEQIDLIKMCDNCRVIALSEQGNDPMKLGSRPMVRTTADYLADAKTDTTSPKSPKTSDDFLS